MKTANYLCTILLVSFGCLTSGAAPSDTNPSFRIDVAESYGKLPLSFEANRGQTDSRVKFLARGPGFTAFMTPSEAVFSLSRLDAGFRKQDSAGLVSLHSAIPESSRAVVRMRWIGANPRPEVKGIEPVPGVSNYFTGNDPKKWRTGIPSYGRVEYRSVYPGIDLVFYGNQRRLEYDLVVAPSADPAVIRLGFEGADRVSVDREGNLILHLPGGEMVQQAPLIYQMVDGVKRPVGGRYKMKGPREVGFEVEGYDASATLTIDPVLVYSTYLGGSSYDFGIDVAVDAARSAYVTGQTPSVDFPTTSAYQGSFGGGSFDAFVAKLNPSGTALVYSTYLGGNDLDASIGIAIDAYGNAYITGGTGSANFPASLPGMCGFDSSHSGSVHDGFVAKLNSSGLVAYATFVGGNGTGDSGSRIAVDTVGNAYMVGGASSTNFPVTPGAFQTSGGGYYGDVVIVKIDTNQCGSTSRRYATYLGGTGGHGGDVGYGIALEPGCFSNCKVYVTGYTGSTNFPTTVGAYDRECGTDNSCNGFLSRDAFVAKLDPAGNGAADLLYSTYLGGSALETGRGIDVDASGNIYVSGGTCSSDFVPDFAKTNAYQKSYGGGACGNTIGGDAFVAKLYPSGNGAADLIYATYLGGSGDDQGGGNRIAVDPSSGNAHVVGQTSSANFPTRNPLQVAYGGGLHDSFLTVLNAAGNDLIFSTFLGGTGDEGSDGVALDGSGNVYVSGTTESPNFPTTPGAYKETWAGSYDAFVVKIGLSAPPSVAANSASVTITEGGTALNSGTFSDPDPGDTVTLSASVGTVTPTGPGIWSWSFGTTDGPAQSQTVTITARDSSNATATATFSLVVNNVAPAVSLGLGAAQIPENSSVNLTVAFNDPGLADSHTVGINWGDGSTTSLAVPASSSPSKSVAVSHQYMDDNPSGTPSDAYAIGVTVTDKDSGAGSAGTSLIVTNLVPVITGVTGPTGPLALGSAAALLASFTDTGTEDTHTCSFSWGDGQPATAGAVTESGGSGSCTATRTYAAAGVYTVTIAVSDDDTGSAGQTFQFVVVYDPDAGFVTGGGWITSPPGAYTAEPAMVGKANFGFVSKYQQGASTPTGQTEFHFHVANFNFHSEVYEWLVISGPRAQYKGSGSVNGVSGYDFLLTANDGDRPGGGDVDKFRIKIWNKSGGGVVYDNVGGPEDIGSANPQAIGGGSIVIHP